MKLKNIVEAYSIYEQLGYEELTTPWMCDSTYASIIELTVPDKDQDKIVKIDNGELLVGSSEQGFLINKSIHGYTNLSNGGKYMSFSPCFRREGEKHYNHVDAFWKLELHVPYIDCTDKLLYDAYKCFKKLIAASNAEDAHLIYIDTDIGTDIYLNGIEIGSYGFREVIFTNGDHYKYTYGTAIAEPRFTQALNNHE